MQKLKQIKKNKRGVMGLDIARGFIGTILAVAILGMLAIIVLRTLDTTSVATDATRNITANVTAGLSTFFNNSGTWFSLLAIVVIILIVAVVIVVATRFGSGDRGRGANL